MIQERPSFVWDSNLEPPCFESNVIAAFRGALLIHTIFSLNVYKLTTWTDKFKKNKQVISSTCWRFTSLPPTDRNAFDPDSTWGSLALAVCSPMMQFGSLVCKSSYLTQFICRHPSRLLSYGTVLI